MRHKTLNKFALLVFLLLTFSACTEKTRPKKYTPSPSDSVYTIEAAMAVYDTFPEKALNILDSACLVGNVPDYVAAIYRARVFNASFNAQRQDSVFVICQTLLQHDSIVSNPSHHQQVLELLVNASRMREDYEQLVNYAVPLTDLLREQGLTTEALRTEAEIGLALSHLGRADEGLAKINDAIDRLDGTRRFNELDASIIAMRRKINVLSDQGKYSEAIEVAKRIHERLNDYAQIPEVYHDNSYREPSDGDRPGYINFYKATSTLSMASAYIGLGDEAAARKALAEFRKSDYSHTASGHLTMASLLGRLGDYDTMLALYDEAEHRIIADGDTVSDGYIQIVRDRAVAAAAKGDPAKSQELWLRYDNLQRELSDSLQRSKAQLYAAMYLEREHQREIQLEKDKVSRIARIASIMFFLSLLSIGLAIFAFRQRRLIDKKNKLLAEQISDAISFKDKFHELEENTDASAGKATYLSVDAMSNEELFSYISKVIVNEKLYLDPMFSRQTLVERLGITTHKIGAAFSQGSPYAALPDYVRSLRLEYACRLLTEDASKSVKAVGEASGFTNNSTFCSDFKKQYGMTPSMYRSLRCKDLAFKS